MPGYCERLRVRPGITGLAQINLPPDSNLDTVRDKVTLDVEYIRTANRSLELRIMICTALKVLCVPGDFRVRLTGVARTIHRRPGQTPSQTLVLTPRLLKRSANPNGRKPARNRTVKKPK